MGCFPPNLSLRVDSPNSGRLTKDWCCHGGIGPPSTARRRMVASGDSPVGPIGPPEIYQRLGTERTARGDFSSIGPVSRFFRSIADPVGEVARAADRPESGQDG